MTAYEGSDEGAAKLGGMDSLGCAGALFLLLVAAVVLGSMFSSSRQGEAATELNSGGSFLPEAPAAGQQIALFEPTDTATPAPSPTALPPTRTPPPTLTPMPTAVAPATATETATTAPAEGALVAANTPTKAPPTSTVTPLPSPTSLPLPTPNGVYSWTLKVPILMYHYISVPPEGADSYRVDLSVSPETFRAQMAYLAENNFTTIDLYDLSLAIANKKDLPAKPVLITLDDGYRDSYENAFPTLLEYGYKATFFIATQFIDSNNPEHLTWAMIEEMAAAGMRFEPHSQTHTDLEGKEADFVIWEILGSQETLAAHIGYTPRYFAYPSGRYDETTIEVARDLDLWGAVTTHTGSYHSFNDRYEWRRLRVKDWLPLADFAKLVAPGDTVGGKPAGS